MITIMYQKGSEITKRNIKVLNLDDDNVWAFCYLRNQKRIFKRGNILSAALYRGNARGDVWDPNAKGA